MEDTVVDTEALRRLNMIAGLRAMADFFEKYPGVPMPYSFQTDVFVEKKEDLGPIARLTSWEKNYRDTWFSLHKEFGENVTLEVNIEREKVCRRVVTGTKILPAQPARTVEEHEWVCEDTSLLGGSAAMDGGSDGQ